VAFETLILMAVTLPLEPLDIIAALPWRCQIVAKVTRSNT
jgi:hypothetical protein